MILISHCHFPGRSRSLDGGIKFTELFLWNRSSASDLGELFPHLRSSSTISLGTLLMTSSTARLPLPPTITGSYSKELPPSLGCITRNIIFPIDDIA